MDIKISNIKERILYFAKNQNISYESFCESIGMTYGSFKGVAKQRPLNSDALEILITKYPEINCEWLLIGKGAMLQKEEKTIENVISLETSLRKELDLKNQVISHYKEKVTFLEDKIKAMGTDLESDEPALLQMIKEIHHITVSNAINDIIKVNEGEEHKEKGKKKQLNP
ncbi:MULTISPECIES: hypothetical protein [Flavobacterium]|uniref:Bacteriophage CI repressor helix-turn-helix domain-containing protein n=1 Tax=Flavobacterium jumunjinense TaxID=998845 RepID=A0ABV5GU38_9FLAO|nr:MULTISPECIES: hypothetical protein [Flavobacterium]